MRLIEGRKGHDWVGHIYEKTVAADNAYGYGKRIGSRYRNPQNIVWCLGGDRMPVHLGMDYRDVWRRMAEALVRGITGQEW